MAVTTRLTFTCSMMLAVIGSNNVAWASEEKTLEQLAHGEKAHNEYCVKCHTDQVYTRENRFVKSIDALNKQVVRCKDNNNIPWFDEDSDAVVQFLNNKYYKF